MFGMSLFVVLVVLRGFMEKFCNCRNVHASRSVLFPFPTGQPTRDLLQEPAVPVWVLERGKRVIGTALRVSAADAWVLHRIVKGAAGVVEDAANVRALRDQLLARSVNVIDGEDQIRGARLGRGYSLAKNDRRFRVVGRELNAAEGVAD